MPQPHDAIMEKVYLAVETLLGNGRVICTRCGATLDTYADVCSADLYYQCQGFSAIETVRTAAYQKALAEASNPKPGEQTMPIATTREEGERKTQRMIAAITATILAVDNNDGDEPVISAALAGIIGLHAKTRPNPDAWIAMVFQMVVGVKNDRFRRPPQ